MTAQQLKNSILQMAVQGKLVPQDPNDEPASTLLERIRAEKERLIREKKIKREKNPFVIFRGADNIPYEKVGDTVTPLEVPFEIPESWEWVRLKNIVNVVSARRVHQADWRKSGVPFYRAREIGALADNGFVKNELFIDEKLYCEFSTSGVPAPGDLMVTAVGTLGKTYIVQPGDRFYYKDASVICLENYSHTVSGYLKFLMLSPYMMEQIKDNATGTTVETITIVKAMEYLIPLPPLAEQHRIVEKIEELMPILEKYGDKESELFLLNSTFPEALKKSILHQAVQGKLVPQDPADEPAKALLERIRAEKQRLIREGKIRKDKHESVIFRRDNSHYELVDGVERCIDEKLPFEIPESWAWCRLCNLCEAIFDIDHNMPKEDPDGVLFLSAKDLLDDGTINTTHNIKHISKADYERLSRKGTPIHGDILYSRIGACLGKARIVDFDTRFLVSYSCCTIRPLQINTEYLQMLLDGGFVLQQAKEKTQSIGVPDLGIQMIKNFLIPLPPVNEQRRIVKKTHGLFLICNQL